MVCLYCGQSTKVINSRNKIMKSRVWRRRQCVICHAIYTTIEEPELSISLSVKNGSHGLMEGFVPEKLFISIYRSLKHRRDPISDAKHICETVTTKLIHEVTDGSIDKSVIKNISLVCLTRFDKLAAANYSAYHTD